MSRSDVDLPITNLEVALGAVIFAATIAASHANPWGFAAEPIPPELCRSADARTHRTLPTCPQPVRHVRKAGAQ